MKKIILGVTCIFVSHAIFAAENLFAINQIAEQTHVIEDKNVWPGFHPNATAILVDAHDRHHAYALNFKPKTWPWQLLTSTKYPTYYLADSSVLNLDKYNEYAFFNVDDQLAYVVPYAEHETYFMKYRIWYYLTDESLIDHKNDRYANLDDNSLHNIEWVKLTAFENIILNLFLKERDVSKKDQLLLDALSVHQYRDSISSDLTRNIDNAWSVFDGTHAFIEINSHNYSETEYYRFATSGISNTCNNFLKSSDFTYFCRQEMAILGSIIYGHELDKSLDGKIWKPKVEKEFKSITQIAIENLHLSDIEAKAIAENAMQNPLYQFQTFSTKFEKQMKPYLAELNQALAEYENMPGLTVHVKRNMSWLLLSDEKYEKKYYTSYKKILFKNIDFLSDRTNTITQMPFATVEWTEKNFRKHDPENSFGTFKINENAILLVDNNKISAKEFIRANKKMSFHTLGVIDDKIKHLENMLYSGEIYVEDGHLTIE